MMMLWNWQQPGWPFFHFDRERTVEQERQFLIALGAASAYLKRIESAEHMEFVVEILSVEGEQSSRIEGEILDRESLQSSIKRQFGLKAPVKSQTMKEVGVAKLLCDVYSSYDQPLTHEMLWKWHEKLFEGSSVNFERGHYRTHEEPMQIVSHRLDKTQVFFEAPPSAQLLSEMDRYIRWFNTSRSEPFLARAAIAHLYFENIHPFEDGNGRIGRALVEKSLSQSASRPILLSISKVLEKRKKEYYAALQDCNCSLDATSWVSFFSSALLQAQQESLNLLNFIIDKSRLLVKFAGHLNERQEKALLRMFKEGPSGFQGGLSAENYITITGASRATATRDLAELVDIGALRKTGQLRHTRYWINLSCT